VYALILPFIYLAIKLDDGGPLLSIQRRYGRGGKVLKIYKIRTMDFTDEGEWVKHNKLNKVTRVGAFLRRSRLDEFPQLWNVLLGDVSLVGPRSDILANGGKLSAQIEYYMMRYTVPPGLSGWAQVNQELPPNSLEETKVRLQYDLYYVKNRSLLLDFIIMVKTFRVLVMRTGL
jgi:lipopolysaccharide/colanic/teichoic acid biosynthesis glycosyltransferase